MDQQRPRTLAEQAPAALGELLGAPFSIRRTNELLLDLLAATELVPADRLALVRGGAARHGSLVQALVDEGLVQADAVARALAVRHGMPFVDLEMLRLDATASSAVPLHVLERVHAVPFALENGVLRIAVADPTNLHAVDELRLASRYTVELAVASSEQVQDRIRRLVRAAEAYGSRTSDEGDLIVEEDQEDDLELEDGVSDAPLVRLVNSIILQAAEDGASDIHLEPQEDSCVVRFRIDGVLQEVQRLPKRMTAGVTTRVKVLAKLDIAERRKPQDGRITVSAATAGRRLDIRVATLPTVYGEKAVMRLLDKSKAPPTLAELGLSEAMQERVRKIIERPTGSLLVTGPTG